MGHRRTLVVASLGGLSLSVLLAGCAALPPNSFLDPTKVGRFGRKTDERLIRRVLGPRETPPGLAGATEPTREDLVAVYQDYRLVPGDAMAILIQDFYMAGGPPYQAIHEVSALGEIRLPYLGSITVAGLTEQEAEQEITARLKESGLLTNPIVQIFMQMKRGRLFYAMGAFAAPGTYPIPRPDLRLLEALTLAGDIGPMTRKMYVIRKESELGVTRPAEPPPEARPEEGWVIPPEPIAEGVEPGGAFIGAAEAGQEEPAKQDQTEEAPTREELADVMPGATTRPETTTRPQTTTRETEGVLEREFEPLIIFDPKTGEMMEVQPPVEPEEPVVAEPPAEEDFEKPFDWEDVEELALEQRVIEIDVRALRAGDSQQNIVVRSGDVLNAPVDTGVFYMMGEVNRPGVYALGGREITVKQAIATAGGFSALAWPQRCELIRRAPGTDVQYTRTVNLDAIFAGLEDDFYMRDDDILNVGTHVAAPFLFVLRNSFRFTYGFGFVYDRNFADKDAYGGKINPETLEIQRRQQQGLPF
jgi:polysaccharide export outer membrane protein